MTVPLEWVWTNDPIGIPDDDHSRCIAASGERMLARGAHVFSLTTRPCLHVSTSRSGRAAASFSTLQMAYRGHEWARGLAQETWGSDRFDSGPRGADAQHAAGLALLATMEGALAAGFLARRRSSLPAHMACDGERPLLRPAGRPPGHARRKPRPSLLPFTVGRGGDLR